MIFCWSVYNQEGTDAADDHVFTSAVTTISGVSKNFTKRGSEVEKSSRASRHIQEAISSVTRVLPCTENVERLVGPFIQTKTENTLYEGTCDKRGQEEELDNHEKLTGNKQFALLAQSLRVYSLHLLPPKLYFFLMELCTRVLPGLPLTVL